MPDPIVEIVTECGVLQVTLFADKAPVTVTNFLAYTQSRLFDNSSFFRIVNEENAEQPEDNNAAIQVIQGGLAPEHPALLPPVRHETTAETGIQHLDGTISMARFAAGTADGSFFFCVGDQPELNFSGKRYQDGLGFAAFGRLTAGRDVLQRIYMRAEAREYLLAKVHIHSVRQIS